MRLDQSLTIGTIMATNGVLFTTAESPATGSIIRSCAPIIDRG